MQEGFVKIAAATPAIRVGDPAYNGAAVIDLMRQAAALGVKIAVFPELCLTGYTCGDLFLQKALLSGALDALRRHDVSEEAVTVAWVPGAFEIPVVAQRMAQSGKFDAVICLGAVIRGTTSHYDVVCNEVSKGIAQVQLATGTPVMMGVLTVDTIEQAIERAGTKAGNKGFECGVGAIEMVNVLRQL